MEWMAVIGDFWLSTLAWMAGLAVAFGVLGRLTPCNRGMSWWKDLRAVAADLIYWFVVPLFLRVGRVLLLAAGVALMFGGRELPASPVGRLPLGLQGLAIVLIQDVLLYWMHRLFHTRLGWGFHAVHHSPRVLDWMSTARFHPLNSLLEFGVADVAVLLMGFSPAALVLLVPFNLVYSAMVHANLNWTFGPLRYVLASPVFHRWHHTTREEGLDRNFAPTFPFLDLLFGTFYMPRGRLPEKFGTGEPDFPEGFWGQLLHPFRSKDAWPSPASQPGSRWRIPAALEALTVLAVVTLVGGGMYGAARYLGRGEPPAADAGRAESRVVAAEAAWRRLLPGHGGAVLGVAISPDGKQIVSGGEDGTVTVWDAATGQKTLTLTGHRRLVCGVAISPDGQRVVSGSHDGTVKVWDAETGRETLTLRGHTSAVFSVAVSPDGRHIFSAGWETVKSWDAETGQEELAFHGEPGSVLSVAVSPDGRRLASASGGTVTLWDARTGRLEQTLGGPASLVHGVAISPDGQHIVTGSADGTAKVWEAETGREVLTLAGHTGPVYAVAFSPDGERIVTGSGDATVRAWETATGREVLTLSGHADAVTSLAISADGRSIVSGGRDGTVRVWDAATAASRGDGHLARRD